MEKTLKTASESILKLLGSRVKNITVNQDLSKAKCIEIYTLIFDTLVEVFNEARVQFSNDAMNYMAQGIYDSVEVNGGMTLDPNIFDKRSKAEDIDSKNLAMICMMFKETDFALEAYYNMNKR